MTLAAYAIPVALAYATLAGLPPQYGVYCYLVAGPAYALFGSSRQLAVGPTSAISMLVGTTVAGMALGDPVRFAQIASLTALVVAAISVIAWALRLSSLVNFVSETILLGFKAGAALTIALTQLPKLFGVKGGGEHFFERVTVLASQLPGTNLAVLGFGLVAIAALVLGERLLPGRPVALVVVIAAIVVLSLTPLAQRGFKVVGVLPAGLPDLALPSLRPADVDGVIPLALACFLLAYIEGVSAARTLAQRHGYAIDPRQELLALGAANAAAAFGQGFPVAGGLSQSTVNDKAGARTPLSLVFASAVIALCLVYLTDLLRNLPDVVLAAIVLVAVKGLVDIRELRRTFALSRAEFAVAIVAFAGVLVFGSLKGVLLAAIVSVLLLIRRAAVPAVHVLGRLPGGRYAARTYNSDAQPVSGVLIVRVDTGLVYFNAGHVRDEVLRLVSGAAGLHTLVWDLSTSTYVDIAGARMLGDVARELAARGVKFRLAEAHAAVRDLLGKESAELLGALPARLSIDDALAGR
jgi:high affinity sulfate transporter 1